MLLRRVSRSTASRPLRSGFTLAELLAVVAILAILAGVAIPGYMAIVNNSRIRLAKSEAKSHVSHLKTFAIQHIDDPNFAQNQGYPDPSSGFTALIADGMLTQPPRDPWGAPYTWELVTNPSSGTLEPVVYSNGSGSVISSIDN
jgi:general secretion pathway protein G